jgi:hypothetical protein
MKKALRLGIGSIDIKENSYLSEIIDCEKPTSAAVFPYSQHFIIRQDLKKGELTSEADLSTEADTFMNRTDFKMMSGDDIKKPLYGGILISFLVNLGIILFLLLKLVL